MIIKTEYMRTTEQRKKYMNIFDSSDESMLRVVYAMLQAYQIEAELGKRAAV